jgi:hypothetical protein
MQIRRKIRFTLLGVVGGWTRTFGVLHDGDTFLALETPIDLYLLAIAAILITQRTNAACTNLELLEGWRIILLHTVVQS